MLQAASSLPALALTTGQMILGAATAMTALAGAAVLIYNLGRWREQQVSQNGQLAADLGKITSRLDKTFGAIDATLADLAPWRREVDLRLEAHGLLVAQQGEQLHKTKNAAHAALARTDLLDVRVATLEKAR